MLANHHEVGIKRFDLFADYGRCRADSTLTDNLPARILTQALKFFPLFRFQFYQIRFILFLRKTEVCLKRHLKRMQDSNIGVRGDISGRRPHRDGKIPRNR
jgi:hypothetical protein